MITSSDKEYIATKEIMLGHTSMNPDFRALADFIDQRFNVRTINIIYDTIDDGQRPRLGVYFEHDHERNSLFDETASANYDSSKQGIIAERFKEIIKKKNLENKHDDDTKSAGKYQTDKVWVYFSAFEPIAKDEANEKVPERSVQELKASLDCTDLWEIARRFSGTTFFLYTNEQVHQYENSEIKKLWADKYFDLLSPYNEFGYFKRENFQISLDSKENFDKNYASNWYYYWK